MEAATLFTVARLRGARRAASSSSPTSSPRGSRIGDDELHAAELRLGEAAVAAL